MNEMLKKMTAHKDYEVIYLGEVLSQQLDDYLSRSINYADGHAGIYDWHRVLYRSL